MDIAQTLQQAITHHQAGNTDEAQRLYHEILQLNSQDPDANHNLGILLIQAGQVQIALPHLHAALEANPAEAQYWLSYINALIVNGQPDVAREYLEIGCQNGLEGKGVEALAATLAMLPVSKTLESVPEQPPQQRLSETAQTQHILHLFQSGQSAEAEVAARNLTETHPRNAFGWKALGTLYAQQGRITEAELVLRKAIALAPRDADAHSNLGSALKDAGKLSGAVASYRQALKLRPDFAEAHYNLGLTLKGLGQMDGAIASFRHAIKLRPGFAQAHGGLGAVLSARGRQKEAVASYRRAIELKPDYVEACTNLGATLAGLERHEEAMASYRRAIEINPNYAEAHFDLGATLAGLERHEEAMASYRRAIEINPNYAEAHFDLGATLAGLGRHEEAIVSYRRVTELRPDWYGAHNDLGTELLKTGQTHSAITSYHQALTIKPDYAEAHNNLGIAFKNMGLFDNAIAYYRRALELKPEFAGAYNNLGIALYKLGRIDDAITNYRLSLDINPDYAEAHNSLGITFSDRGEHDAAIASCNRALEINPAYKDANTNLLFCVNYHPEKRGEEVYRYYEEYEARYGVPLRAEWQPHDNVRDPARRLKVGYVSPSYHQHSVRHFLEPLLSHHDKNQVEVYAYAEMSVEDDATRRYRSYADHWISTWGMSDAQLAQRIRADGIDILVDVAGHVDGNRLLTFARKPAPVSLHWLEFGYTTGLKAIDYYLTDAPTIPEGSEHLFSETPWKLPVPAYAYRPDAGMGDINPLPVQERGYITFGTLTRSVRINDRVIKAWAAILKAVPCSRLSINSGNFKDVTMQDWMAEKFAQYGISRERLEIGFESPAWKVLQQTDISLDCFPHNSGTTLFESLYMGVPFVTLAGRPSVGTLGASILHGAGHPEWIAATEEDYIKKAIALAQDLPALARHRASLRNEMKSGPLMDEAGFAGAVEQAYRQMWQKWCQNIAQ